MKRQEAPGRLELVRAFLNTLDLEHATDGLTSPTGLRDWLISQGLAGTSVAVTDADRLQAVELREAIRAFARANTGVSAPVEATRAMDFVAAAADVRLRFAARPELAPAAEPDVLHALGEILAIVGTAALDGSWPRLRVCAADDCRWAFYDHSKNRSGRWCQMAECGNRAKARTFRDRRTASGEA